MLRKAASPLDQNSGSQLQALQKKAIHEVTYELIRQVTSPNDLLRNHVCILLYKIKYYKKIMPVILCFYLYLLFYFYSQLIYWV